MLVVGIAEAVQGMAWVLGFAALVLYMAVLLGLKLVDRSLGIMPHLGIAEAPILITVNWQMIFNSMFNHFKVMNALMSSIVELLEWQCEQFLVYYVIVLTVMGVPDFQTHRGHWP